MNYERDSLILTHLQLAEDIAVREWRTATHALEKEEMISLAYEGLVLAAERWLPYCKEKEYDPEAIQYFKAFASFRIRGNIRDFIRKKDWATRTLRSKAKKLKDAGQDDGLSINELAEKTGMSTAEINKVRAKLAARPVSLDAKIGLQDFKSPTSNEMQLKVDVDTEAISFANDMNSVFIETFQHLENDIKVILTLHYYSRLDLRTIADQLVLSEAKVSQLHAQGVIMIRDAIASAATESDVNA